MITKTISTKYDLLPEGRAELEAISRVYIDENDPAENGIFANDLANSYLLKLRAAGVLAEDKSYSLKKVEKEGRFSKREIKDSALIEIKSYTVIEEPRTPTAPAAPPAPVPPMDRFLRSRLTKEFKLAPSSGLKLKDSLEIRIEKSEEEKQKGFRVYEVTATAKGLRSDIFNLNSMVAETETYTIPRLLTA